MRVDSFVDPSLRRDGWDWGRDFVGSRHDRIHHFDLRAFGLDLLLGSLQLGEEGLAALIILELQNQLQAFLPSDPYPNASF